MATAVVYMDLADALMLHFELMWLYGESRFGVFAEDLIESALARPQHAAVYESADLVRQAATLCFGLIKNHPWTGGNKRTATALTEEFLRRNGWQVQAALTEIIALSLAVEADRFGVDEIEVWYRQHTTPVVNPTES